MQHHFRQCRGVFGNEGHVAVPVLGPDRAVGVAAEFDDLSGQREGGFPGHAGALAFR